MPTIALNRKGSNSTDRKAKHLRTLPGLCGLFCLLALTLAAQIQNPMSAKVEITPLQSYSGGKQLPKPSKILVYDFAVNLEDVQVDATEKVRLRHIIEGDKKPAKVGDNAAVEVSKELVKALKKTGIPVEHAAEGTAAPSDALVVRGTFLSIKEGEKAERVAIGMGTGSAEVKTQVQAQLKTSASDVMISEFETNTTLSKNMGAGMPVAAGMNPAVSAGKAEVSDRKKNVSAYSTKTGDAAAKQIISAMAGLGWVKVDGKGNISQ